MRLPAPRRDCIENPEGMLGCGFERGRLPAPERLPQEAASVASDLLPPATLKELSHRRLVLPLTRTIATGTAGGRGIRQPSDEPAHPMPLGQAVRSLPGHGHWRASGGESAPGRSVPVVACRSDDAFGWERDPIQTECCGATLPPAGSIPIRPGNRSVARAVVRRKKKMMHNGAKDGASSTDHGWSRLHRVAPRR
jgi:hypothetical protein